MQLELWGLDYFDLFLVHFPVALAYVDPSHRYPPEWWGDDRKSVNLREHYIFYLFCFLTDGDIRKYAIPGDLGGNGRISRRGARKEYRC
jgi:diketogulonate reductase-like aldo/keto reductase